jgi:itaconate CoA-transferase
MPEYLAFIQSPIETFNMLKPLEGIIVVAIEQAVAAPFCTARLADAGARVIKIERPEGDFARGYDAVAKGQSSYFVWLNRGKESVVLDLRQRTGRAALATLIAQADVMVQNLKPGAMNRLGFSNETLRTRHPRLICCSISGYGDEEPYANRKAYDLLIQADSGLSSITGTPDAPARVGISMVDISTGATAHAAILEALIARRQTGLGTDIRTSMFDTIADWLTVPLLHSENGNPPRRAGLAHPSIAPYGVFPSRDGREILISIQSDREWKVLCETVMDRPDMVADARFATNVARVRCRPDTDQAVAGAFANLDASCLIGRLEQADVAFAEVNDMNGLSKHPHLRRVAIQSANGTITYPAPAPIFDGATRELGACPALGADTDRVLAEFVGRGAA